MVSVVMPLYNGERYAADAIESILGQTLEDFELIIIDDGSTDASAAVASRYAQQDPRIRLVSRTHRGITATRNEALSIARGRFVAESDSDDISLPQRLQKQLKYLEKYPQCALVGCRLLLIDPDGAPIRVINMETSHEEIVETNLNFTTFFVSGAYMVRREAIRTIGGFREEVTLAEDRDLYLRLAEHHKLANIPEVLYHYRQHTSNTCLQRKRELKKQLNTVVARARARHGLGDLELSARHNVDDNGDQSIPGLHRKWAWWALSAGYVETARKHAFASLRRAPLSIESWRVTYCALRGR